MRGGFGDDSVGPLDSDFTACGYSVEEYEPALEDNAIYDTHNRVRGMFTRIDQRD